MAAVWDGRCLQNRESEAKILTVEIPEVFKQIVFKHIFEIIFDTCLRTKFQFQLFLSSLRVNMLFFLLYNTNSVSVSVNLPLSCHTFVEWNCSPTKHKCPAHSSGGRSVIIF